MISLDVGSVMTALQDNKWTRQQKYEEAAEQQKKLFPEQLKQQGLLDKQSMGMQYGYNEKSAENAFEREKEMNKITYDQASVQTKVKQMKDAGLNVGLMYGNSGGSSGGGAGSTGGGKQSSTSGGTAKADSALQTAQLGLNIQMQKAQIANIAANTAKTLADTSKVGKERKNIEADTGTKEELMRKLHEEGRAQWIANILEETTLSTDIDGNANSMKVIGDSKGSYKSFGIVPNNPKVQNAVFEALGEEANKNLTTDKTKALWAEVAIGYMNADSKKAEAAAKRLAAEYQFGETANWKWWANYGEKIAKDASSAIGAIKKGGGSKTVK